jgi:hypothetical protein
MRAGEDIGYLVDTADDHIYIVKDDLSPSLILSPGKFRTKEGIN